MAALWRVALMPIDTVKTVLQVEGKNGLGHLRQKIAVGGPGVMFHGSLAALSSSWVGNFPWFFTFNLLQSKIPQVEGVSKVSPRAPLSSRFNDHRSISLALFFGGGVHRQKVARNAAIGFTASVVSDTIANSIRVTKVVKQAAPHPISYPSAVREVSFFFFLSLLGHTSHHIVSIENPWALLH